MTHRDEALRDYFWNHRSKLPFPALQGSPRGVLFLDRDDTINIDPGYLSDPDQMHLLPGIAEALRTLVNRGYLPVVLTNQSGVGRGHFTPGELTEIHRTFHVVLAALDAPVYAWFSCPHIPEEDLRTSFDELPETARRYVQSCACRKPKPGLWKKAMAFLPFSVDMNQTWTIGDRKRDVTPALEMGGSAIMIGDASNDEIPERAFVVSRGEVDHIVDVIRKQDHWN